MHTATAEQVRNDQWLDNLEYCLCGSQMVKASEHLPCLTSGIQRGMFADVSAWKEYCKLNRKRVADHYRKSVMTLIPVSK